MKDHWPLAGSLLVGTLGVCLLLWLLYFLLWQEKTTVKQFIYKDTPQGNLAIKLHLPANWTPADQRPAIIFFFGGGWISGGIDHFKSQAIHLARRGMVAALVDYRVDSRHHTTPDQAVADGFDAFKWLYDNAEKLGIDPLKIVSSGSSAGGHIAACLALCDHPESGEPPPPRPSLLVLFNPVLDLTNASRELEFSNRELELINMMPAHRVTAISPNKHINEKAPPTLLIFGDQDPLISQGEVFTTLSRTKGVTTKTAIAPGQKHGFFNREPWLSSTTQIMDAYLVEQNYLSGPPTDYLKDPNAALLLQ